MPPFEQVAPILLWGVLPALVSAFLVTALFERLGGPRQAPAGAAIAFIAAVMLGLRLLDVSTPLPGESSWNLLPWAVLAAICVGCVARMPELPTVDGWLLRGATAFGLAWWIVPEAARTECSWLLPAFAGVIFLNWVILDRLADGGTMFCLSICFFSAGALCLYAGIARFTDIATVCGSALAGIAIAAWWRRADVRGVAPAVALGLPALMLITQRETAVETLRWPVFLLPAVAPLLLMLTLPLRHWPTARLYVVRLFLVAIPLAAAVILARLQAGPLDFGAEEW